MNGETHGQNDFEEEFKSGPSSPDEKVSFWERIKAGNIDDPESEAYRRWGKGGGEAASELTRESRRATPALREEVSVPEPAVAAPKPAPNPEQAAAMASRLDDAREFTKAYNEFIKADEQGAEKLAKPAGAAPAPKPAPKAAMKPAIKPAIKAPAVPATPKPTLTDELTAAAQAGIERGNADKIKLPPSAGSKGMLANMREKDAELLERMREKGRAAKSTIEQRIGKVGSVAVKG